MPAREKKLLDEERLEEASDIRGSASIPLLEAIRGRRSVRHYQDKLIAREHLEELLRYATHAPSACNRRGWKFIVVEDEKILHLIYAKGGAAFIPKARQAVLVCYIRHTDNMAWKDREQSAAAAIAYFQLLAHAEGIGSCWICHLPTQREIARLFHMPFDYLPMALVTVGYYRTDLKIAQRKLPNERIVSVDIWDFDVPRMRKGSLVTLLLRKIVRGAYYMFPKREWLRKLTYSFEKKFDPFER